MNDLDAFRSGDPAVLSGLFSDHHASVRRLLELGFVTRRGARVLGCFNPDDLDELVQETFTRAFRPSARSSYDGLRPFRPFLLRVAKNLLIDRARARRAFVPLSAAAEAGVAEPVEERLDLARRCARLRAHLQHLTGEAREVAQHWLVFGTSEESTARALGVSRRRVRAVRAELIDGATRALALDRAHRGQTADHDR